MPKTKLSERVFPRGQRIRVTAFCFTNQCGKVIGPAEERGVYWVELDNRLVHLMVHYRYMEKEVSNSGDD